MGKAVQVKEIIVVIKIVRFDTILIGFPKKTCFKKIIKSRIQKIFYHNKIS